MKEATGELNMTVITLVAVAAVGALFYFVIWPMIQKMVVNQTCSAYGDFMAIKLKNKSDCPNLENDKTDCWACCPKGTTSFNSTKCIYVEN